MNDVMSKVSSFYCSKDATTYQPKLCNFIIIRPDQNDREVAQIEVNMAKFANHTNSEQHLRIPCDDEMYNGLFLDVVWTIIESSENTRHTMSIAGAADFQTMKTNDVSEEELAELFQKAGELENQNKDLEAQIDLVLQAKNHLEKILFNEKKNVEELRQQLHEEQNKPKSDPQVEENHKQEVNKYQSEVNYLIDLIKVQKEKNADLESQVQKLTIEGATNDELKAQVEEQQKTIDTHVTVIKQKSDELDEVNSLLDQTQAQLMEVSKAAGQAVSVKPRASVAGRHDKIDDFAF